MFTSVFDRCQAITKKGTQCRNYVYPGSIGGTAGRFCTQHERLINGSTS